MHRNSLQNNTLRLSLILLLFVSLTTLFTGAASAETIIGISPQMQSIGENEDFIFYIYVEPEESISGAQFDLNFDKSQVNVKDIQEGDFFTQTGATTLFSQGTVDNSLGTVTGVYSFVLGKNMVATPGTLATIHISSTNSSGICKLQLSNVVVSNSSGDSIPTTVIDGTVQIEDISTSPVEKTSSGGSSGGGAASLEPSENVKLKEISQCFITNGVRARYTFKGDQNDIRYVEFDPKRSFGKTTAIIEMLKEKSALTPVEPEGKVYQHMNIWIGSGGLANPDNIGNAIVGFRVSKAWITKNGIIVDSITLQHFDEGWNSLQTVKVSEDDEYIYFEAKTPGFSPFAITANSEKIVIEAGSEEEEVQAPIGTEHPKGTAQEPEEQGETGISKGTIFPIGFIIVILIGVVVMQRKKYDEKP